MQEIKNGIDRTHLNKFSYKATCFNHVNQEIFLNLYSKKTIYYVLVYRIVL